MGPWSGKTSDKRVCACVLVCVKVPFSGCTSSTRPNMSDGKHPQLVDQDCKHPLTAGTHSLTTRTEQGAWPGQLHNAHDNRNSGLRAQFLWSDLGPCFLWSNLAFMILTHLGKLESMQHRHPISWQCL